MMINISEDDRYSLRTCFLKTLSVPVWKVVDENRLLALDFCVGINFATRVYAGRSRNANRFSERRYMVAVSLPNASLI